VLCMGFGFQIKLVALGPTVLKTIGPIPFKMLEQPGAGGSCL
jgi:hypothetical protein